MQTSAGYKEGYNAGIELAKQRAEQAAAAAKTMPTLSPVAPNAPLSLAANRSPAGISA